MNPTDEQAAVRDSNANTLLVSASAGTGKTATLVLYAQARPDTPMTYLAFNQAVKNEAKLRFPKNVRCVTTHGLAYPSQGLRYKAKIGNPKPYQIAPALGLHQNDAGLALKVVTNFLTSAHREICEAHTVGESIPPDLRGRYVEFANKAWAMMCDIDNLNVSMPHDGYLKLYQISDAVIDTGVILYDEAQDANPVSLAIVEAQKCRKVFVGDSRQSIYSFRGAVNAMETIKADQHLHLATSFRFGPGVARLANAVLSAYDPQAHPIVGKGKHKTCYAVDRTKPHTVLSRPNAMLFGEAVSALKEGVPFGFIGGVDAYKLDNLNDSYYLSVDRRSEIKDKMIQSFRTYDDMVAYGEALDDKEIKAMVGMVEEYGDDIPGLIERIRAEAVAVPTGSERMLTTGHRSKGLEWLDVVLTDDFTDMQTSKDESNQIVPPPREEINLLYVAITRALRGIEVHPSMHKWLEKADWPLDREVKTAKRQMAYQTKGAHVSNKSTRSSHGHAYREPDFDDYPRP
jgi:F-box protein 18 (helicase)